MEWFLLLLLLIYRVRVLIWLIMGCKWGVDPPVKAPPDALTSRALFPSPSSLSRIQFQMHCNEVLFTFGHRALRFPGSWSKKPLNPIEASTQTSSPGNIGLRHCRITEVFFIVQQSSAKGSVVKKVSVSVALVPSG